MSRSSQIIQKIFRKHVGMMQNTRQMAEGLDADNVSRIDFALGGRATGEMRVNDNEAGATDDGAYVSNVRSSSSHGNDTQDCEIKETGTADGGACGSKQGENSRGHDAIFLALIEDGANDGSDRAIEEAGSSHASYANRSNVTAGGPTNKGVAAIEKEDVEEIEHTDENGTMLPFLYIPTLPDPQYWDQPLHMTIQSMMEQEDYEGAMRARSCKFGYDTNKADRDEIILVVCPDNDKESHFHVPRMTLERSPFLGRVFASSDFVQGSETALWFIEDPAKCFTAVWKYMESGPDVFNAKALEMFATYEGLNEMSITETMTILIGLHKLAHKLDMMSLRRMTIEVLHGLERKVDVFCSMNIASLVFGQGYFRVVIEEFALKHVRKNFRALNGTSSWNIVLENHKESRLSVAWAKMRASRKQSTSVAMEGKGKEPEVIQHRIIPSVTVHGPYSLPSPDLPKATSATDSGEYEQAAGVNDDTVLSNRRSGSMEKARETLGELPTDVPAALSYETGESYARRTSIDPNYKARKVMGMNSDGGGKIAGRRKQSLAKKASIRAARAAEIGVKKIMG